MSQQLKIAVNVLLVLLVLLALSWVFVVLTRWNEVISKPERMSQLISDIPFILAVGFAGVIGYRAHKRWAPAAFVFAVGAFNYATARTVAYMIWDNYFGVPWVLELLALLALTGYAIFAVRSVLAEQGMERGMREARGPAYPPPQKF